tara:strand:+ start:2961 stop:3197 length:237 start_codon:yes stop_codon:yes gene_type:complete
MNKERKERERVITQTWIQGLITASLIAEDAFISIQTKDTSNSMDLDDYRSAIREIAGEALEEVRESKDIRTRIREIPQ